MPKFPDVNVSVFGVIVAALVSADTIVTDTFSPGSNIRLTLNVPVPPSATATAVGATTNTWSSSSETFTVTERAGAMPVVTLT